MTELLYGHRPVSIHLTVCACIGTHECVCMCMCRVCVCVCVCVCVRMCVRVSIDVSVYCHRRCYMYAIKSCTFVFYCLILTVYRHIGLSVFVCVCVSCVSVFEGVLECL